MDLRGGTINYVQRSRDQWHYAASGLWQLKIYADF